MEFHAPMFQSITKMETIQRSSVESITNFVDYAFAPSRSAEVPVVIRKVFPETFLWESTESEFVNDFLMIFVLCVGS